jgi:membrane protein implicated in regulation of membrane protease activity
MPGVVLLVLAGVLIIVVLVKPSMPGWLRTVIAILAVLVVLALLVYAYRVFRGSTRRGGT